MQEYDLKKLGQQAVDFHDDLRDLISFGKYAFPIVAAVPDWAADNGEMAFYDGVAGGGLPGKRIYVRLASTWSVFAVSPFSGIPGGPEGAIQFNSSNAFAGEASLLWSASLGNTVMVMTGQLRIEGTNNAVDILRVTDDQQGPNFPVLRVSSNGNTAIYAGSIPTGGQGIISIGNFGGIPTGRPANTAHIYAKDGESFSSIYVQPEVGGPHIFGDVVVLSDASVIVRDLDGTATLSITGLKSQASPAGLSFNDNQNVRFDIAYAQSANGTNIARGPTLIIGPNAAGGKRGFVLLSNGKQDGIDQEVPQLMIGLDSSGTGVQGGHIQFTSSNTINDQRSTIFFQPRLHGASNLAANTSSIVNAATVFIQGPPIVVTANSLNVQNRYALWVGTGPVRIDGELITSSVINNGGIVFPTVQKTSAYTATTADATILVDARTSSIAITLFSAIGNSGRAITIKDWKGVSTTSTIPIFPTSSQLIDGSATWTLSANYSAYTFLSDGSHWAITSHA